MINVIIFYFNLRDSQLSVLVGGKIEVLFSQIQLRILYLGDIVPEASQSDFYAGL